MKNLSKKLTASFELFLKSISDNTLNKEDQEDSIKELEETLLEIVKSIDN